MKIADLIPSRDTLDGLQGVEKQLQARRYRGAWSLLLAAAGFTFQLVKLLHDDPSLGRLAGSLRKALTSLHGLAWQGIVLWLTSFEAIVFYVAIISAGVWLITRYTGILFKQSNNPFRYTFSIEDFSRVKDTPAAGHFEVEHLDQMNLLRNDLIERLKRRVQRFSLLETPSKDGSASVAKDVSAASHFHIKAEYAIREDESGAWILHVWPRIRIGADGNSYTLAYPVRVAIGDDSNKTKGTLEPEEYQRLVERVYSSIATEIYKQIEIDLRDKMTLFPTLSLRALARYVEAEDFETSNTIDAYDRALDMYRTSLEELKASQLHWFKTRFHVKSAMRAEAKTKLGYSRCLIYRRLATEMAGRERNSIFACKQKLRDAIHLLGQTYNSFFWFRGPLASEAEKWSEAEISTAQDAVRRPLERKLQYRQVRDELCETLAVAALAYSTLDDSTLATKFLKVAETLVAGDCHDRIQLLLFLAKAELEPVLRNKLLYLNQGKDLSLDSEIALYRLAYYSDLLARDENQITGPRVENLNHNYEAVLRVNPANVASLIGQGYLLWLVDRLDEAAKKLNAGIELQKIVKQTFVGDLKYCLARVKVEQFWKQTSHNDVGPVYEALFLYEEATAADPSVEACFLESQDKSKNTYYNLIDKTILEAYERFANRAKWLLGLPGVDQTLSNKLFGYALNDEGNARLNYYFRHQVPTTGNSDFRKALELLDERQKRCPETSTAKYNYFLALIQADPDESPDCSDERIRLAQSLLRDAELLPAAVLVEAVKESISQEAATNPTGWPTKKELIELSAKNGEYRELLNEGISDLEKLQGTRDARQEAELSDSLVSSRSMEKVPEPARPGLPKPSSQRAKPIPPSVAQWAAEQSDTEGNVSGQASISHTQFAQKQTGTMEKNADRGAPKGDAGNDSGTGASTAQSMLSKAAVESVGAKLDRYRAAREKLRKLDELEQPMLQFIRKKTRLAPFEKQLDSSRISNFLENPKIDWLEFGDAEVYVFMALADVWSRRPDEDEEAKIGSRTLCKFIRKTYGRDSFAVNWILLRVTSESQEKEEALQSIEYVVNYLLNYDSKSHTYLRWKLDFLTAKISTLCKGWPFPDPEQKYSEEILSTYKNAEDQLDIFPAFHRRLAQAYEMKAKVANAGNLAESTSNSIAEYREVCRRNPNNRQDRLNLLASLSRQMIAPNDLQDPFEKREAPKLIEVEFSSQSIDDLGLTESGLPSGLHKQITDLRATLKREAGFVLPGINFRDNRVFEKGVFRLLIRGVPSSLATLDPGSTQEQQWDNLTRSIRQLAIQKADNFYTSQDCYWRLSEIAKEDQLPYKDIQDNSQLLSGLTWVLKTLLSEQTPIIAIGAIVAEFRRCQAFKLDLVTTVENVRSIPAIREQLKGNSLLNPPAVISTLNGALEGQLNAAIDWSTSGPILTSEPAGVRNQIRSMAFTALKNADRRSAVIVTTPRVRPFVRKMLADVEVSVLSTRELSPDLFEDKETDAARPKQLHAAAGN